MGLPTVSRLARRPNELGAESQQMATEGSRNLSSPRVFRTLKDFGFGSRWRAIGTFCAKECHNVTQVLTGSFWLLSWEKQTVAWDRQWWKQIDRWKSYYNNSNEKLMVPSTSAIEVDVWEKSIAPPMIDGPGRLRIGKAGPLSRGGKNWVNSTSLALLQS